MLKAQVSLRAEKLGNIAPKWRGKKSGPYASLSLVGDSTTANNSSSIGGVEVGKTEVIYNCLSPKWTTIFIVEHSTTKSWTPLKITIHDSKSKYNNSHATKNALQNIGKGDGGHDSTVYRSSDPIMGEVNVEVGEILRMEGQEARLELEPGGCIYVHITQSVETLLSSSITSSSSSQQQFVSGTFHCHLRGLDLENIEKGILGLGAIDPYYEVSKKYVDHANGIVRWIPVYRSEHIPNIINPYWQPFGIDLEKLCHGNATKSLKIGVWDYQHRRSNRWLGEVEVSVEMLQKCVTKGGNACREDALSILDEDQDEPRYKTAGLHPVGRLDYDTTGLILFSLDGTLTQRLLHPKRGIEKQYVATVQGVVNEAELSQRLAGGVTTTEGIHIAKLLEVTPSNGPVEDDSDELEDMIIHGDNIVNEKGEDGDDDDDDEGIEMEMIDDYSGPYSDVTLTVKEGKYRMVRRMLANCGHPVVELRRLRHGKIILGDLPVGEFREATEDELEWAKSLIS